MDSSSSASGMSSAGGPVPFFVASSTASSTAAGGALSASVHSAFSFPAGSTTSLSSSAAAFGSSPLGLLTASSAGASSGTSAKRISFCSALPQTNSHPAVSSSASASASASASVSASSSSRSSSVVVSSDDWYRLLSVSASRGVDKRSVSSLVLRWLVAEGYADVADCFEAEALLKADRPSAHIEERTAIRKLILSGDVAAAVSRCNALYPALLDQPQHAALSFMAQQQTLIELIREQRMDRALAFARQEMAPRAQHHPALMTELEKTMSLLAFPQPATQSPYATLMSQQRRHGVSSAFNAALLQQQQQTMQPSSSTSANPLTSLQPTASDLVRLVHRLQCLQPQLACTHSLPLVAIACKPSAAVIASGPATGSGVDGAAVDGASSASQRSNSVVSASPALSSAAMLSPVASRTPVTMPFPSRSLARHQQPSPFLLSSSAQSSVPPSPVSLSPYTSVSASSSRRSSLTLAHPQPEPFALPSPAAAPSARAAASHGSLGSSAVSGGSRGGSSASSIIRSVQSAQRGGQQQQQQHRRTDDDSDMT